jgi:hypothetical protein
MPRISPTHIAFERWKVAPALLGEKGLPIALSFRQSLTCLMVVDAVACPIAISITNWGPRSRKRLGIFRSVNKLVGGNVG